MTRIGCLERKRPLRVAGILIGSCCERACRSRIRQARPIENVAELCADVQTNFSFAGDFEVSSECEVLLGLPLVSVVAVVRSTAAERARAQIIGLR